MLYEPNSPAASPAEKAAPLLAALALFGALALHLLPALFAGLLVHVLVHALAPRMFGLRRYPMRAKIAVVILLTVIVTALAAALIGGAVAFFRSEGGSLVVLLQKMADIIESARPTLPEWVQDWLPGDSDELKDAAVTWLRTHAAEVRTAGGELGRALAYALVGMVVGALVALRETEPHDQAGPLALALRRSATRIDDAFKRVVFAQVRIAALNAGLTAIYLALILPALGVQLPLTKTMIAITFVAGLLPIIGNLISNVVIVVISLSYSLPIALASLLFLVVIHKLEYFINARIVGSRIHASAWELLIAMLVMEAAFGLAGVIAAPVYYAYLKSELTARGWI